MVLGHILTNLNSTSVPLQLRGNQDEINYYLLTIVLAELCVFFAFCTIILCSYFVSVQLRTHYLREGFIVEQHLDVEKKSCFPSSVASCTNCPDVRLNCCTESKEKNSCSNTSISVSCKDKCINSTCLNCTSHEKVEEIPLEVLESTQKKSSPSPSEVSDVVHLEKTINFNKDSKVHFKKCSKQKVFPKPQCKTVQAIVHTDITTETRSFCTKSPQIKSSLRASPSQSKKSDRKSLPTLSENEILELDTLGSQSTLSEFQSIKETDL